MIARLNLAAVRIVRALLIAIGLAAAFTIMFGYLACEILVAAIEKRRRR